MTTILEKFETLTEVQGRFVFWAWTAFAFICNLLHLYRILFNRLSYPITRHLYNPYFCISGG